MVKFVGVCVGLFVLALGIVIVTQGQDLAALLAAFRAEPLIGKIGWLLVVLMPLVALPSAVWLCDTLVRQRKAAQALELRLDGVRQDVKDLSRTQIDAEAALHHLARSDPEAAIGAMQQRLTEADYVIDVQERRNEMGDLNARVDELRQRQQALRQRLAPVLDKRRTIERLFLELDTAQSDLDRALAEIASGDDAVALDLRLKKLAEFLAVGHGRCDEIEAAAATLAALKEKYAVLASRLTPLAAADGGITARVKELSAMGDKLASDIEALRQTPQGALAERLRRFADDRQKLDGELGQLNEQFARLATLRKDVDALSANFDRALDLFAIPAAKGKAGIESRVEELSRFIVKTQERFAEIEDRMGVFCQLHARLNELQTRIGPIEASDTGVVSLIGQVQDIHDRLLGKLARLEEGDSGDLAGRVKTFTEAKRELEQRVAAVSEEFVKLTTIRRDITGLVEKLSSAVNGAPNAS